MILPQLISKEPLGPMVRPVTTSGSRSPNGSSTACLKLKEYGVTQANVDQQKSVRIRWFNAFWAPRKIRASCSASTRMDGSRPEGKPVTTARSSSVTSVEVGAQAAAW